MFVEPLPSGKYRGGYRAAGKKVTRTFAYEWEAREWATAGEAAATAPVAPAAGPVAPVAAGPTVDAYGAEWLTRKADLAKATTDGYRTALRALTACPLGAMTMGTMKRSDVERWRAAAIKAGVGRPTINATLKVLRMVFLDAIMEGAVETNPTAGLKYLTTDIRGDHTVKSADAETRLLAECRTPRDRAMVLLGIDAGLRWQEAAGLPAGAVVGDFLVIRQVVEKSTGTIRKYPKGHRSRNVPMTDRLVAVMSALAADADDDDALLFPNRDGGPLDYSNWYRTTWRGLRHRAGLGRGTGFHDLRHTYGSRLAASEQSVPRSEIAELMGHADEATTRRYIHTGDDGRRRDMVRAALGPSPRHLSAVAGE